MAEPRVVYVPGDRQLHPIRKGEQSPIDGVVVPDMVMLDIGPCLANALGKGDD